MSFRLLPVVAIVLSVAGCGGLNTHEEQGDSGSHVSPLDARYRPVEDLLASSLADVTLGPADFPDGWTRKLTGREIALCQDGRLDSLPASESISTKYFEDETGVQAVRQGLYATEDGARWLDAYRDRVDGCTSWKSFDSDFGVDITSTLELRDFGQHGDEAVGLRISQTGLPEFESAFVDVVISRHDDIVHILAFTSLGNESDDLLRNAIVATAAQKLLNPPGIDLLIEP